MGESKSQPIALASRAVDRNRSNRRPPVLSVQLDRLDDQVKSVHAVDFARHTVSSIRAEAETFGEVQQAIHTAGVGVEHEKHRARGVFGSRDQEQMIGAEVEHRKKQRRSGSGAPAPIGSAVVGLAGGLLRAGYQSQRGAWSGPVYSAGGSGFLLALRRLSPPSRKISEFSTSRSAMAVAMVVLNRMLPQSENGVLVVMRVERLWL